MNHSVAGFKFNRLPSCPFKVAVPVTVIVLPPKFAKVVVLPLLIVKSPPTVISLLFKSMIPAVRKKSLVTFKVSANWVVAPLLFKVKSYGIIILSILTF